MPHRRRYLLRPIKSFRWNRRFVVEPSVQKSILVGIHVIVPCERQTVNSVHLLIYSQYTNDKRNPNHSVTILLQPRRTFLSTLLSAKLGKLSVEVSRRKRLLGFANVPPNQRSTF